MYNQQYFVPTIENKRIQLLGQDLYDACYNAGSNIEDIHDELYTQIIKRYIQYKQEQKAKQDINDTSNDTSTNSNQLLSYDMFLQECHLQFFVKHMETNFDNVDKIYEQVQSYEELLLTNIAQLQSKLPKTFFYNGRWGDTEDQNNHAQKATDNLILLHNYKLFTINGQSNFCGYETPESKYPVMQMSYVEFFTTNEFAMQLLPHLLLDKRVYVSMVFPDGVRHINNMPPEQMLPVTTYEDETTFYATRSVWRAYSYQELYEPCFPLYATFVDSPVAKKKIEDILKTLVFCTVICREQGADDTADDILLTHVKQNLTLEL